MPRPRHRTRSRKRVEKKVPGGRIVTHYKREKVKPPTCRICGKPLTGLPRETPSETRKLNRTRRRVSRMFGGQICARCLKLALRQAARTV